MKVQSVIDFPPARGPAGPLSTPGGVLRLRPAPPALFLPAAADGPKDGPKQGRRKLWSLAGLLHCSVIGTCLSAGELRQALTKAGLQTEGVADHDLHREGVAAAGRHDIAAKLIHKALDVRHRLAIRRFERAGTSAAVHGLWNEFVARGEIPGAYWAALTHPATDEPLVRTMFGEVHMLSHLVGAANRADIRRLASLEAEREALQARFDRQQARLREAVTTRDAVIRDLRALVARTIAAEPADAAIDRSSEAASLHALVADLERRLGRERARREKAEAALDEALRRVRREQELRAAGEAREAALGAEIDAVEARLHGAGGPEGVPDADPAALDGRTLLYVGGRPEQVPRLRSLAGRMGAELLHHDGGVEDRSGLLAGLVHRADMVMFPVDCVSHQSVNVVKRLCRQMDKAVLPLRSQGLSSFLAALATSA